MVSLGKCSAFFFVLLTTAAYAEYYTVAIEPEQLQNIINHRSPVTLCSGIKNFLLNVLQLIGITASLVSANLITNMFQSSTPSLFGLNSHASENVSTTLIINPSEMCGIKHQYGCIRDLCWRTCDNHSNATNMTSWCFTTAHDTVPKYQHCKRTEDCSPCWECLGVCHTRSSNRNKSKRQ